jgi:hypothetical protein
MRKKGGILAVVAGLYGALAATITLIVLGGIGSRARIDDLVVCLGWAGVVSSVLTIILGTICLLTTTSTRPALLLALNALVGAVLSVTPVKIFMALAFIGGLLAVLGGVSKPSSLRKSVA